MQARIKEDIMDVKRVLRMAEGTGETSYASNSSFQKSGSVKLMHLIEKAIHELCSESSNIGNTISVADLGCSSGPNTLWVVSEIINMIDSRCQLLGRLRPQYLIFLNDLESNDFNTVFKTLLPPFYEKLRRERGEEYGSCFVTAMPGSFYGRLFPDKSLNFVHSSFSLHWLSQVPMGFEDEMGNPLNKGNIYIGDSSPPIVSEAYSKQFQRDFSSFLRARSMEMVDGGEMVVILAGRRTGVEGYCWSPMTRALQNVVSQGFIEESKLDSFNLPLYHPSMEEVKDVVVKEGSFYLNHCEGSEVKIETGKEYNEKNETEVDILVKITRAKLGPILAAHFGEDIIDKIFESYKEISEDSWAEEAYRILNIGISLTKRLSA